MKIPVTLVDAFTRTAGQGNRAGVVEDAARLDEATMQRAAAAVAASETAFVLQASAGEVRLRYLTPGAEVPFCGHATVATLHRLAELDRVPARGKLALECPAGRLEVELEPVATGTRVWIVTPQYPWTESPLPLDSVMDLLGGSVSALDPELPVRRAGPKLFVPLTRRRALHALWPRFDDLARAGDEVGLGGFFVFTREAAEPGNVVQGRFFCPKWGIREDPVTGAANGPLAVYLAEHGVLRLPEGGGTVRGRAEQGDAMGKPGRVELEVTGRPGRIDSARIGGVAVTVLEGDLVLA